MPTNWDAEIHRRREEAKLHRRAAKRARRRGDVTAAQDLECQAAKSEELADRAVRMRARDSM